MYLQFHLHQFCCVLGLAGEVLEISSLLVLSASLVFRCLCFQSLYWGACSVSVA